MHKRAARVALLCCLCAHQLAFGAPVYASRELRGVDMMGECAVVAHHDNWEDEASGQVRQPLLCHNHPLLSQALTTSTRLALQPQWDYKVKVFPWTVFAHITIRLRPPVDVQSVWAATKISEKIVGRGAEVGAAHVLLCL